jgi:hypothetical protein
MSNSETLMVFFTFILALATAGLTLFTAFLWWEGRTSRKQNNDAQVTVGLEAVGLILNVVVENVGKGIAKSVRIRIVSQNNLRNEKLRPFFEKERTFDFLKSRQRVAMSIGPLRNLENKEFCWDVEWTDLNGQKRMRYEFDAMSYFGPTPAGADFERRILSSLEKMATVLAGTKGHLGRIDVNIFNSADRKEEDAEMERQWDALKENHSE